MTDGKISPPTSSSISKEEQPSEKQTKSTLSQREVFGTLSMDALVLDQPFPSSPRRPSPRSSPSLDAAPAISSSSSLDDAAAPSSISSPSLDNAAAPALDISPPERIDEPPSPAPSSSAAKSLSQREVFGTLSMDALQLDQPFPLPSAKRAPPKRDALTPEQLHRALQQNAQISANHQSDDAKTHPAHDARSHATASKTSIPTLGSTPNNPTPAHNPRTRTLPLLLGAAILLAALTALFLLRDKIF